MDETPTKIVVARNKKGHFLKGQSGNPLGGPKTLFPDGDGGMVSAGALFRRNAAEVHDRLLTVIRDQATPHGPLISAIKEYNDRAFGRPAQAVEVTAKKDASLDYGAAMDALSNEQLAALALIEVAKDADASGDEWES